MAKEKKSQTEGKEVAEVSQDDLALALAQSKSLQEKENAGDGVKADHLLLAKQGTKALKKSNEDLYIEGLKKGDIFIQKDKINLGKSLDVVPLAFVALYQEKSDATRNAQFFGVWNAEQAKQFDLVEGSYFNRQLPNGHILMPVNWVMVEVIGHREIEHAVIAFKSTGSRIWKSWKDDAKSRSETSATLVYTISEGEYDNKEYDWTDFTYDYKCNLLEKDKAEALFCLKKSNAIRETISKNTLVPNHDVASISAKPQVTAYIEDASETEESFDDDEAGF